MTFLGFSSENDSLTSCDSVSWVSGGRTSASCRDGAVFRQTLSAGWMDLSDSIHLQACDAANVGV